MSHRGEDWDRPALPPARWYQRRADLRERRDLEKRRSHRTMHRGVDETLVAQTHLRFRRMDVAVYFRRRQFEVQNCDWMPARRQGRSVGFLDDRPERGTADPAAVNEERHAGPVSSGNRRGTD